MVPDAKENRLARWFLEKLNRNESKIGIDEKTATIHRLSEQRTQLEENLEEQLQNTVQLLEESDALAALGTALSLKDEKTGAHSRHVSTLAVTIAREIGIPKQRVSLIAKAAFLHDIGKLAVANVILKKPGPLDPTELAAMQEHCYRGHWIVSKGIPSLTAVADIVYAHHERFDGTGYPRGLRGAEIPFEARIMAIANTLDAMTRDWPYRVARTLDDAVTEIERCAGSQFDPEIVETFMRVPVDIWRRLASTR